MKEDNLPFLLPFSIYYLLVQRELKPGKWLVLALLAVALVYIALSQGRAALLGMLVMLFLYGIWVARWSAVRMSVIVLALLSVGVGLSLDTFFRASHDMDWLALLDRFTSYRTQIWRQALQNPPDNGLLGVGMANTSLVAEVIRYKGGNTVGHLHNFLMDAWYETGLLGLGALLVFICWPFWKGLQLVRRGGEAGRLAGLFMTSAMALLVAGLLSFSYTSRQFAFYLPILLAALWVLSRPARTPR